MPSWIVNCDECNSKITHSPIEYSGIVSYFLPLKPDLEPQGTELECPECGEKAIYQRSDLRYQA
jgi:DNA-directed RNA polymerase subunit RPC12/RpoP